MSRIGNNPITLPQGITISKGENNTYVVKGKLGELTKTFHPDMDVKVDETSIVVARPSDSKEHKSIHGLTRSLITVAVFLVRLLHDRTLLLYTCIINANGGKFNV